MSATLDGNRCLEKASPCDEMSIGLKGGSCLNSGSSLTTFLSCLRTIGFSLLITVCKEVVAADLVRRGLAKMSFTCPYKGNK